MDLARDLAQKGCPGQTLVIAARQTSGRGRFERLWHSASGGLYFTMVLRPVLRADSATLVLFAASVSLARSIRSLCNVQATIKWPNDILAGERKLAGMLSEMQADGDCIRYVNIGIGLNVNNDPSAVFPNSVSLCSLTGKKIPRRVILSRFLDDFEKKSPNMDREEIMARWRELSSTLNKRVRMVIQEKTLEGLAVDIDGQGRLVLKLSDGSHEHVAFGDCFHQELF
jgi:BirA family biotin operon repressor/biotin-[acetyl-CoA-carboxylase] ligase